MALLGHVGCQTFDRKGVVNNTCTLGRISSLNQILKLVVVDRYDPVGRQEAFGFPAMINGDDRYISQQTFDYFDMPAIVQDEDIGFRKARFSRNAPSLPEHVQRPAFKSRPTMNFVAGEATQVVEKHEQVRNYRNGRDPVRLQHLHARQESLGDASPGRDRTDNSTTHVCNSSRVDKHLHHMELSNVYDRTATKTGCMQICADNVPRSR